MAQENQIMMHPRKLLVEPVSKKGFTTMTEFLLSLPKNERNELRALIKQRSLQDGVQFASKTDSNSRSVVQNTIKEFCRKKGKNYVVVVNCEETLSD